MRVLQSKVTMIVTALVSLVALVPTAVISHPASGHGFRGLQRTL